MTAVANLSNNNFDNINKVDKDFANSTALLSLKEAAKWVSEYLEKEVSVSNISYLIQYAKIRKFEENGSTKVSMAELKSYYENIKNQKSKWEEKLGDDLNWELSFKDLREKNTTKHVHRLHPYKGKFIPQLVEYFIDTHTDSLKKDYFFSQNDIILDPFMGSGTTLVQANELGVHSIGIDISPFNCLIANCKTKEHDLPGLQNEINRILKQIDEFQVINHYDVFDKELSEKLSEFNNKYFPSHEFKFNLANGKIDHEDYILPKEKEFLSLYNNLVSKYNIKLKQENNNTFLDSWFLSGIRDEIEFVKNIINKQEKNEIKETLQVILSRTVRSCRATTHSDLATLKEPQTTTYYCHKHKKICKPIFSIKPMFKKYAQDTLSRLAEFKRIKSSAFSCIINADSRIVDIAENIKKFKSINETAYNLFMDKKIKGIFTSPPYVGQIDYHEQHAYSYELFKLQRYDNSEIGPLFKGQGRQAKEDYVEGISKVLVNCKKYLADDFDIFIVANDKYNLYREIAELAGLQIINQYKRPVLNRTERDKSPYGEFIFHMKGIK